MSKYVKKEKTKSNSAFDNEKLTSNDFLQMEERGEDISSFDKDEDDPGYGESEGFEEEEEEIVNEQELLEELEVNASNSFQIYLKDIYSVPTLEPYEEVELAERMAQGDEEAQKRLIEASMRFVVTIARRYKRKDISLMDLIQEGSIGLIQAVERFDITKGKRFSAYATYWIRSAIMRAIIGDTRTIKLPAHIIGKMLRIKKATRLLHEELGREPTIKEIAKKLNTSVKNIEYVMNTLRTPASFETPIGGADNDGVLEDIIEDPKTDTGIQLLEYTEEKKSILDVLKKVLTPREEWIIRLRFGLSDGRNRTLDEIGRTFGLGRDAIRKIEKGAMEKLKDKHCISQQLHEFLEPD